MRSALASRASAPTKPTTWSLDWLVAQQAYEACLRDVQGYARPCEGDYLHSHFWPADRVGQRPLKLRTEELTYQLDHVELTLPMPVRTKARPRAGRTRTGATVVYGDPEYMAWKQEAAIRLRGQWRPRPALRRVERLEVTLVSPAGTYDPDNALGAVLDAMTQGGVISDDKVTTLPTVLVQWVAFEPEGIVIRLHARRVAQREG